MSVFLKRHGLYLGVDPAFPAFVYGDRQHGAAWEEVLVTAHAGGLIDVVFVAANRQLTITPDGQLETRIAGTFQEWEQLTVLPLPASGLPLLRRVNVSPSQPIEVEGYTAQPPAAAIHLEVQGTDFVDAQGQRTFLLGTDGFDDYWFWLTNRRTELDALMKESQEIGFGVHRIWCMGDAGENQVFSLYPQNIPNFFPELRPFVKYENSYGIIPLFTAFVDAQRVMPDWSQKLRFWEQLHRELQGSGVYMVSAVNQVTKNWGADWRNVFKLPNPGAGIVWSRGSDIEDTKLSPDGEGGKATFSELHATRISLDRALMDATASPPNMRQAGSTVVAMTEGMPIDDSGPYSEFEMWQLGRVYSSCWGLMISHDRQHQRGQLYRPGTRAKAEALVKGARL